MDLRIGKSSFVEMVPLPSWNKTKKMFHENMAHNVKDFGVEMKKVFGVAAKYGNFMHFARRTMLYQKLLILKLRSRGKKVVCTVRESNPVPRNGKPGCYHYTNGALVLKTV